MEQNSPTTHMGSTQIHFFPINASLLMYFPFTNFFGLQSILQLLLRNYSSPEACILARVLTFIWLPSSQTPLLCEVQHV